MLHNLQHFFIIVTTVLLPKPYILLSIFMLLCDLYVCFILQMDLFHYQICQIKS